MIDTDLPGSFADLQTAATWLGNLGTTLSSSLDRDQRAARSSGSTWSAETQEAYESRVSRIVRAGDPRAEIARACSQAVTTYAWELQACQRAMESYRQRAVAGGLHVNGTIIEAPVVPAAPEPMSGDASEQAAVQFAQLTQAHTTGLAQQALYLALSEEAQSTLTRVQNSINQTLVPAHAKATSDSGLTDLLAEVMTPTTVSSATLTFGSASFAARGALLRKAAAQAADDLARRRSGNPKIRVGDKPPTDQALKRAAKPGTRAGNLFGKATEVSKWGKWIGRAGVGVAVVGGAYAISQGESPGKVVLSTAAGLGAAALVVAGAAAATFTFPAWGVAAVAVIASAAAAQGLNYAWDNWVPEGIKSAIDDGARAAWNWTADRAGDAWTAGKSAVGGAAHAVNDAWQSVFG